MTTFFKDISKDVKYTPFLTFHKWLFFSHLQKSYKNTLKKIIKKVTSY